jgi:hypothetical protein
MMETSKKEMAERNAARERQNAYRRMVFRKSKPDLELQDDQARSANWICDFLPKAGQLKATICRLRLSRRFSPTAGWTLRARNDESESDLSVRARKIRSVALPIPYR